MSDLGPSWPYCLYFMKFQECFPGNINIAFIIKPEKFWEKQRTSLGSSKYNFEVSFVFVVVVVALLFYVHGKHLRSCRDGQLT